MTEYFDTNVNAGMKTAEEILKSKLNPSVAILNNPDYTFNKVIEAIEEYADQFKHLPTENEIRAQALLMENKFDNYTAKIMELHEIQKMPTSIDKIHESCFRNSQILVHVLNMIERGDSKDTIFEVVDLLKTTPYEAARAA
jgi:hypothetical protein